MAVVAGPNGAGKSTTAPRLLRDALAVTEFVNADAIAAGLSAFRPESVAFAAGRLMLGRIRSLAHARQDVAFETTLASRVFAPQLRRLRASGYRVQLAFLSLPNADLAVARVAERVRTGGHDVPEAVVRRRFGAGLRNLMAFYLDLADVWQVFDNSMLSAPRLIASKMAADQLRVLDPDPWQNLLELAR